jgi:hypothetical protein
LELLGGYLDADGYVQGALLIHVISGSANIMLNLEPSLSVAGDVLSCLEGKKIRVIAVDKIILDAEKTMMSIKAGSWYGRDVSESIIGEGDPVPDCIKGAFAVSALDARNGTVVVAKKELRLEKNGK